MIDDAHHVNWKKNHIKKNLVLKEEMELQFFNIAQNST